MINPFDEIAVEEACACAMHRRRGGGRLHRRQGVRQQIRHALAMGADRAVWVEPPGPAGPDGHRGPAAEGRREGEARPRHPRQAGGRRRPGPGRAMLAERLGWGQASFASKEESLESDAEKSQGAGAQGERGRQARRGGARGRRRPRDRVGGPARRGHHGPAPQPAALRLTARHHEGQEEGNRGADARGPRRGRRAAGQGAQARSRPARARPASRCRTWRRSSRSCATKPRSSEAARRLQGAHTMSNVLILVEQHRRHSCARPPSPASPSGSRSPPRRAAATCTSSSSARAPSRRPSSSPASPAARCCVAQGRRLRELHR